MLRSHFPLSVEAPERPLASVINTDPLSSAGSDNSSGFAALVASMLRCRRCSVLLTDSEGNLVVEDAVGLPASARGIRIPMGRGIAGRVAAAGEPPVVSTGSHAPPEYRVAGADGTDPWLSAPGARARRTARQPGLVARIRVCRCRSCWQTAETATSMAQRASRVSR